MRESRVSLRVPRPGHSSCKAKRCLTSWEKVTPHVLREQPHLHIWSARTFVSRALFQPHQHKSECRLWWIPIHSHRPWCPVSSNTPTGGTPWVPTLGGFGLWSLDVWVCEVGLLNQQLPSLVGEQHPAVSANFAGSFLEIKRKENLPFIQDQPPHLKYIQIEKCHN